MLGDKIWEEIRSRALAWFNRDCAAKKIGHWPTDAEAVRYFMGTPFGLKDVLALFSIEEYPDGTKSRH